MRYPVLNSLTSLLKALPGLFVILVLGAISSPAQINIPAGAAVSGPTATPSGSLNGEYWQRGVWSIFTDGTTVDAHRIDNQIKTFGAPSGRFRATQFVYLGNDLSAMPAYLGADAASYVGASGNLDDGAFRFTGFVNIGAPTTVSIGTTSDDGSRIKIAGIDVVNNDGGHGDATVDTTVTFAAAGLYPVEITFFNGDWTSDGNNHSGNPDPGAHGGANFHLRVGGADITAGTVAATLHSVPPSSLTAAHVGRNRIGTVTDNGGGSFSIVGGGNDIWDNVDEFTYAYQEVTGDFDVSVRVESLAPNARWTKAGLMVRESLAEDSRMLFPRVTPLDVPTGNGGNGANDNNFSFRTGRDESTAAFGDDHNGGRHEEGGAAATYAANPWLRLVRVGNIFTSYFSPDGVTWTPHGGANPQDTSIGDWTFSPNNAGPVAPTVLLGLGVGRHSAALTAAGEFRSYSLTLGSAAPFAVIRANSRGNPNGVRLEFNHPVGVSGLNAAKYTIDGGVTVSLAGYGPNQSTIELTTSALTEGTTYTVTVAADVTDAAGSPIGVLNTATFTHGVGYESRRIRIAHNQSLNDVVDIYQEFNAYTQDLPVSTQSTPPVTSNTIFEQDIPSTGDGLQENYAAKISGVLNITTAGNYRFFISSDDNGRVYLSSNDQPANKVEIAREPAWNGFREFITGGNQATRGVPPVNISALQSLAVGRYYLEAVFSEGGGGNSCAVAWEPPGGPAVANGSLPIPEANFTPTRNHHFNVFYTLGPVTIARQPSNQQVASPDPASFIVSVDGTPDYRYQWQRRDLGGVNFYDIPGATSQRYTLAASSASDSGAEFRVVVCNDFSRTVSDAASLTVGTDTTAPTLISAINVGTSATEFDLVYSEAVNEADAEDLSHYAISGGVTLNSATLQADGKTVRFTCTDLSAFTCKTLTVNDVRDASGQGNLIAANSQIGVIYSTKNALVHRFDNIGGVAVADLTNNAAFPNSPTFRGNVSLLEYPANGGNTFQNYGTRVMAFLSPQVSGDYTFYLSADDGAALWLSTDENPANKVRIANEPVWAASRQWTGAASGGGRNCSPLGTPTCNISNPVNLQGGCRYYLEYIFKEGGGGDYGAVTWRTPPNGPAPNVPVNGSAPIGANYISSFLLPATIVSEPQDVNTICGRIVQFCANIVGTPPLTIQWYRDDGSGGVAIDGATGLCITIGPVSVADSGARFYAVADTTDPAGHVETRHALLTVGADTDPPQLLSVSGSATFGSINLVFNEILDEATATEVFTYATSPELVVTQAVLNPDRMSVTLLHEIPQVPNTVYTVTVSADTVLLDYCGNVMPRTERSFRSWVAGCGGLLFEAWNNIGGTAVSALTSDPRFPNSPDERRILAQFDTRAEFGTDNYRDNYGAKVSGIFIPTTSGRHIFYVHSDDASQLFLNPNGPDPAGKVMIAEETGCCRDWPAVFSAPIQLNAGQAYYIEGLFKEGGGGDYIRVAAQLQGSADPLAAIGSSQLGNFAPPGSAGTITITQQPANATVPENTTASFSVVADNTYHLRQCYQWQRDSGAGFVDIPGANGTSYSFVAVPADDGACFRVAISIVGELVFSNPGCLDVIPDTNAPCLLSATADVSGNRVILKYSELMEESSTEDPANYSIDGGVSVLTAELQSDGMTVILTTSQQTPGNCYTVTVQDVIDRATTPNVIGANCNRAGFCSWVFTCGLLRFDFFGNIPGVALSSLTSDPRYPNSPDLTLYMTAFDTRTVFPNDSHDNYGARITGVFIPPTSGDWIFYLASDDPSQLFLNPTGTDPAGKVMIVEEPACCGPWTAHVSAPIPLVAGQQYYIEGIYKEGGGGDYMKVAARLAGQPAPEDNPNQQQPVSANAIPGSSLGIYADPSGVNLAITDQPDDQMVCIDPLSTGTPPTASFTVDATALRGSAGTTLACVDFNSNDGGFTVETPIAYDGPWVWNSGTGTWQQDGQGPENQHANTSLLTSPSLTVGSSGRVQLSFVHRYSFEPGSWDGGQVRISVNNGPFTRVPGSAFTQGGYSGTVLANSASLLAGQEAYVQDSPGSCSTPHQFITSIADLGSFSPGDTIRVQFIAASDTNTRGNCQPNWEIDSGCLTEGIGAVLPVIVQWQKNTGSGFTDIPGALGKTYSFTPSVADNGNQYRARVATPGAQCTTSDAATLTVIQQNTPPRFTCGTNQVTSEDSGPQTVPAWATDIRNHSIDRVPDVLVNTDFTSTPAGTRVLDPNGTGVRPDPRIEGGILKLTDSGDAGGFGGWAIGPFTQRTFESLEVNWQSRIGGGGGGGADGYSMNFGTDLADNFQGEEGSGTGLSVAIDTFDNADVEVPDVGIEINWGGARVAFTAVPKDDPGNGIYLRKDQFVSASLTVSAAGVATFTYDGNIATAALPGYTGLTLNQVNFGARTGGANDNQWVDNLNVTGFRADASSSESSQTVQFLVSNDNPSLFSSQPAVSPDGTLTYTAAPDACGTANITVVAKDSGGTACNGRDTSEPCVRTITIEGVNDCPIANSGAITMAQCTSISILLTGTDPDVNGCGSPISSYGIVTPPLHGTLSGTPPNLTYTPVCEYCGPDSFTYTVSDGDERCQPSVGRVDITIICNRPPVCDARIRPEECNLTFPNNGTNHLLAMSASGACVILDASGSTDPEGDTLTFKWTIDGTNIFTTAILPYCFSPGCHDVILEVSDGRVMCRKLLTVCVITPCEAVEECILMVENTTVERKNKRPLITSLKSACDAFDRGSFGAAINKLEAFIHKVSVQIGRQNPNEAAQFIECAQRIIEAVQCGAEMDPDKGNNGVGNGEDPPPPGNDGTNDEYPATPGNPGNKGRN